MSELKKSIPTWILIVSGIFALMELAVSVMLWAAPESFLEEIDLTARGAAYVVEMWAVRQFALGAIFTWAIIKRSNPMLSLCYVFFLVMFIGDITMGIKDDKLPMLISGVIMSAISLLILMRLKKNNRS